MPEKKTKEQIEAEILKEATGEAEKKKSRGTGAPVVRGTEKKEKTEAEKPTTKEKLSPGGRKKTGLMGKALDTVRELKEGKGEKKERKIRFERVYTVPLRVFVSTPQKTRASMKKLRSFVQRHSKAKEIKIDNEVNHYIYARGHYKPPHKIRIAVAVDEEGLATVRLK